MSLRTPEWLAFDGFDKGALTSRSSWLLGFEDYLG